MKIYCTLLICLWGLQLIGQDKTNVTYYIDHRPKIVFAQNGLNIRSKPNLNSEKIGKIPYGEKVQVIHKDHYGYQLLNNVITENLSKYQIDGVWLKIKYKKLKGYVLSTFLYPDYGFSDQVEPDYVILSHGLSCSYNIHNINSYNWYGLYVDDNNKSALKSISLEFYNVLDNMTNMITLVQQDKDLQYVIGSKRKLPLFKDVMLEPFDSYSWRQDYIDYPCDTTFVLSSEIIAEYSVEHKKNYAYGDFKFYKKTPTGWQSLYPNDDKEFTLWSSILYEGDFDSDGKMDYIVTIGEKSVDLILYLSSAAEKDEAVKHVASAGYGPCC